MGDQRTSMKNARHGATVTAQDIYEESASQKHKFGERLVVGDRVFRYCKNGTVALTAGKVVMANNSLVAGTIAATAAIEQAYVTVTTTGIAAGDYDEGYLNIDRGTGAGSAFKIKDTMNSGASTTKLELYDCLPSSLATTTQTIILKSRYSGVKIANTSAGIDVVGVPLCAVSPTAFAWIQTKGPCACHISVASGANIYSRFLVMSSTTLGSLNSGTTAYVASTATGAATIYDYGKPLVARCMTNAEALTALVYNLVDLMLE